MCVCGFVVLSLLFAFSINMMCHDVTIIVMHSMAVAEKWTSSWGYGTYHQHPHSLSPEPSLFANMKHGSRRKPKIRHIAHCMAAHTRLKNEFMEDKKYHNLMRWHTYSTADENHNEIDVRSTFTIQSYVRIDRFGIDYQSVIDQSYQFIHLPIIQSFKSFILLYRSIHSTKIRNRKTDEIHKCAQCLMRFIYSVYLFNNCHNFIYFDSSDWYVLGGNKFYFSCKIVTEK